MCWYPGNFNMGLDVSGWNFGYVYTGSWGTNFFFFKINPGVWQETGRDLPVTHGESPRSISAQPIWDLCWKKLCWNIPFLKNSEFSILISLNQCPHLFTCNTPHEILKNWEGYETQLEAAITTYEKAVTNKQRFCLLNYSPYLMSKYRSYIFSI